MAACFMLHCASSAVSASVTDSSCDGQVVARDLPDDTMATILSYLTAAELKEAIPVSRQWRAVGGLNCVWEPLYIARFEPCNEDGSMTPSVHRISQSRLDDELLIGNAWHECMGMRDGRVDIAEVRMGMGEDGKAWRAYRDRLACPFPGDRVQVAWSGKFRLDSSLVFVGISWWDAEVVSVGLVPERSCVQAEQLCPARQRRDGSRRKKCHPPIHKDSTAQYERPTTAHDNGIDEIRRAVPKFRVHYRSWSRRWDEWVDPSCLRWRHRGRNTMDSTAFSQSTPTELPSTSRSQRDDFAVKESVELWCHGDTAGGAWLDAKVRKVSNQSVCLSDMVLTSQLLWVSRDRVRAKSVAPVSIAQIAQAAYCGGQGDETDDGIRDPNPQGDIHDRKLQTTWNGLRSRLVTKGRHRSGWSLVDVLKNEDGMKSAGGDSCSVM